jgi:hypothetical protein
MRTASELEAAYTAKPVWIGDNKDGGSGVLTLAGRQTSVLLTTPEHLRERGGTTGWFDLALQDGRGEKIFLHNALTRQTRFPNRNGADWEFELFPNIVVLNAGAIAASGRVLEIQFTADGLEDFFHYELTERQPLYQASSSTLRSIRDLRKIPQHYPRTYDHFSPTDVYVLHDLPRVLRERVGDRTYEIYIGHRESIGLHSLTLSAVATAKIRFDSPVLLDEALDAIWSWRRYFQQIAMRPLPFLTLSCRAGVKRRDRWSELYLPNLEGAAPPSDRERTSFGPGEVTYGQWRHRRKFAAAMRRWLELDQQRRLFRVRVDRVLEAKRKEASLRLVAELCSAIESLDELKAPMTISDADLSVVIEAAASAGAAASPPIARDRLQGVLSLLQHQSLPKRLKLLAAGIEAHLPKDDAKTLIKIARDLRTFDAHGGRWDEMTMPLIAPTIDMLASMCVLWDLTTSDLPAAFDERTLVASRSLTTNAMEIKFHRSSKGG